MDRVISYCIFSLKQLPHIPKLTTFYKLHRLKSRAWLQQLQQSGFFIKPDHIEVYGKLTFSASERFREVV